MAVTERLQARLTRQAARSAVEAADRLRERAEALPASLIGTLRHVELLAEADAAEGRARQLRADADALEAAAALRERTDVIALG